MQLSRTTLIGALTETNVGVRPTDHANNGVRPRHSSRIRRKELAKNITNRARTQIFTEAVTMGDHSAYSSRLSGVHLAVGWKQCVSIVDAV